VRDAAKAGDTWPEENGPMISLSLNPTDDDFLNPERGLYVGIDLRSANDGASVRPSGHSLAIALIRLDDYRDRALSDGLLASLDAGFADVRAAGIKVVLRFMYNAGYQADAPRAISGNASGGRLAAPAWAEFYRQGWKERPAADAWAPPPGMVARVIDAETGKLANEWCPLTQREYFKPGSEPTEPCDDHYMPEAEDWVITELGDKIGKALKRVFKF
jgi:hypothetical protein